MVSASWTRLWNVARGSESMKMEISIRDLRRVGVLLFRLWLQCVQTLQVLFFVMGSPRCVFRGNSPSAGTNPLLKMQAVPSLHINAISFYFFRTIYTTLFAADLWNLERSVVTTGGLGRKVLKIIAEKE